MVSISLKTVRLFVAIDLDESARQAIGVEQQRLAKVLDADRSLNWVNPAHMHLTLAFLGEIADAAVPGIVDAISLDIDVRPFTTIFEGCGLFPPRGAPRVLNGRRARDRARTTRTLAAGLYRTPHTWPCQVAPTAVDPPRSLMQSWWITAGAVLLVAIIFWIFRPRRRRGLDLGVISDQWINQHRASKHDQNR